MTIFWNKRPKSDQKWPKGHLNDPGHPNPTILCTLTLIIIIKTEWRMENRRQIVFICGKKWSILHFVIISVYCHLCIQHLSSPAPSNTSENSKGPANEQSLLLPVLWQQPRRPSEYITAGQAYLNTILTLF